MTDRSKREALRVVLSYPTNFSDWGRYQVESRPFRTYLRQTHDELVSGDIWLEFVDVGCCGNTLDVPLRVERVEGGTHMGDATVIIYKEREGGEVGGGWRVQSSDGPTV